MNRGMTVVAMPSKTAKKNGSKTVNSNDIFSYLSTGIIAHLPAKVFMTNIADIAAINTVDRECLMAMMAAMKKVLSPNSETMITETEAMKA